ncbi:rRNA maturation RNase YbeY [Pseudodesulfovibrio cashew]|uniref:Endoribonuclease YbeY n=1 Tax=Pseudodesulfovibrio cashew TaxID=2678688 RepID=A0A6I6JI97_9BACT|nr:rRNA maturation RNase YbeY [Pseudodesulfovibrio cashew]QGY40678.1 rRNA maturation RNase YbeY [Pseudodesulfovibrio cashew]
MAGAVTVIRETRLDPGFPLSRRELSGLLTVILDSLGLEGRSVEVKLVGDGEIARLNREFMGCEGPTNILSFPSGDEDGEFMGALALSVDAVARESFLYGQQPTLHLARLLAHGVLHLAGHDHGEIMYDLTDAAVDRVALEYAIAGEDHAWA